RDAVGFTLYLLGHDQSFYRMSP
ncbi:MAG: hypothetical protein JWN99_2072, partial [Ilumatobacteraceae bacterium]|nr:hypothetical protein [Ilumatobacteraceae bacterium]